MQEMQVRSLGQEDPLEEEMATHSSIIAWKILWTEKPGGLQPIGSKRNQIWLSDQTTTRWFWCQLVFAKHLSTLQFNKFDPIVTFWRFSPSSAYSSLARIWSHWRCIPQSASPVPTVWSSSPMGISTGMLVSSGWSCPSPAGLWAPADWTGFL